MINLQWREVKITEDGPTFMTAIRPEEADELATLAWGQQVVEVGAAHGYSAIVMARNGAHLVVSIDDHNGTTWLGDTLAIMQRNIVAYGLNNIVIMPQLDSQVLPTLNSASFGLFFVDGDGGFDSVWLDLMWAKRLVKPGGYIAVHDYDHELYPDKKKACDRMFPDGPDKLVTTLFIKQL